MQDRVTRSYERLALRTSGDLAPVGAAWSRVRQSHPEIELYQGDGSHPSAEGTYLAACVFYAVLFKKEVLGAAALGLDPLRARLLQQIAQQAVLDRIKQ